MESSLDKTGTEFIKEAKEYKVVINELKALLNKGKSHQSSMSKLHHSQLPITIE